MKIASSVELGPGIRLDAPSRSRNLSDDSQRRRRTTSFSMMAMWAAGPPNAVNPRRRKRSASSERVAAGLSTGGSLPVLPSAPIAPLGPRKPCVDRQRSGPDKDEKQQAEKHRVVGVRLVCHREE